MNWPGKADIFLACVDTGLGVGDGDVMFGLCSGLGSCAVR